MFSFSFNKFSFSLGVLISLFLILLPQFGKVAYIGSNVVHRLPFFLYGCLLFFSILIIIVIISKSDFLLFSKLDFALLALIVYITLNRYVLQAIFGFSFRYIELLGLGVFYLVLKFIPLKSYYFLLLSIVVSGIVQAIYGNLQLFGFYSSNHASFKMTGSFQNPGPYAGFLTSIWPIALSMYMFKGVIVNEVLGRFENVNVLAKRLIKYCFEYLPLFCVVSMALVVPASQSRASWLAIIISSLILVNFRNVFLKRLFNKVTTLKKIMLSILCVIIIGAGFYWLYHFKEASVSGRLFIWRISCDILLDNLFFGVGIDRFKAHYMNYQASYFEKNSDSEDIMVADNIYYAFNEWLQFLIENGILGLLLLCIVIYFLKEFFVDTKNEHWVYTLKLCLLSISIFAFFSYSMHLLPVKLVLTVILAFCSKLGFKSHSVILFNNKPMKKRKRIRPIITILSIVFVFVGFIYIQMLNVGLVKWNNSYNMYSYGLYGQAVNSYKHSYGIFYKDGDYLMNYGKALSMAGKNKEAIRVLQDAKQYLNNTVIETTIGDAYKRRNEYVKAEKAYRQAANMVPSRFYPLYLLAKLYVDSGQSQKAIEIANELLVKDVKVPSIAIEEIKDEMASILVRHGMGN